MTIRETVKQFITSSISGNQGFTVAQLIIHHVDGKGALSTTVGDPIEPTLNDDQIRRALRDIPYVKRVNGHYVVKGRRVPNV